MNSEQADKLAHGSGFAALDQSGGSTPNQMRSRIITSPSFDGDRIIARDRQLLQGTHREADRRAER